MGNAAVILVTTRPQWAGVNPERCTTDVLKLRVFLEEFVEILTRTDDIGGGENSFEYITDEYGNLLPFALDYIAYVFVWSKKDSGSSLATLGAGIQDPFVHRILEIPDGSKPFTIRHPGIRQTRFDPMNPRQGTGFDAASGISKNAGLNNLLTFMPINFAAKAGALSFGADLANQRLIYAGFGDENRSVRTAVRNIGFGSLESLTTAMIKEGRFIGTGRIFGGPGMV
jgi:hypothetical protein